MARQKRVTVYATVRTYAGNSEMVDALVDHEADVKSLISGIEGFKAYYVIRTAGGTATVSVYDSQAGADASTAAAAAWIAANLPDLAGSAPVVAAGEVVISA